MPDAGPPRRAVWAAGCFALGIALSHYVSSAAAGVPAAPWLWFAIAGVIALAGWLGHGRFTVFTLAAAMTSLGIAWYAHRVATCQADHISRFLTDAPRLVSIEGTIVEQPRTTRERSGRLGIFMPADVRTSFTLRAERWLDERGGDDVSGRLWVGVDGDSPGWSVGDRVRILGMARAVSSPSNPGEIDRRAWARSRGIGGTVSVDAPGAIVIIDPGSAARRLEAHLRRTLERLRANARSWVDSPEGAAGRDEREARALLRALLLGQREHDLSPLHDAFTRLGVSHILSISGLNLAILAGAFMLVLRLIGDRPRIEALLAALAIITYLLVIPVRAPVLRAALMVLAFLAAETSGRRYDRLTILAWVMILVLIVQPLELFSAGFQLSFGVVAALMTLTRPVRDRLFGPRPQRDTHGPLRACFETVKDAAAACIVAWAAASPLIAYHVGIFSPLGAPVTLAIMPLVTIIMGVGYVTLIAAVILPPIGAWVSPVLTVCASLLAKVAYFIDAAPWTVVYLPRLTIAWTILCGIAVVWWMAPVGIEGWSRRARRARLALTLLVAGWLSLTIASPQLPHRHAARLDSIDVADGSCHLLRTRAPHGRRSDAVLFDCGSLRLAIGERTIPSALRALGAWRVPTIILSHPDIDHYAAVLDLVQPLGVRRVLIGEAFERAAAAHPPGSRSPTAYVLAELRRLGVEVRTLSAGDRLELAGASIEVLSPARGSHWRIDNDASIVMLVSCETADGQRRILMTGDIQTAAIATIMESRPRLTADIMEAPHHGSFNRASAEFIRMIDPSVVIQSTGPRRAGDERWNEVKRDRQWLTTAEVGAASIIIDRSGRITTRTWKR